MENHHRRQLQQEMERNPFAPLGETIYFILLQDIVSYKFKTGDKLKEAQLADAFGVSRSPVRWALQMLVQQGMLEKTENSAALVTSYTEQEWQDLMNVRVSLESTAASLAAARMTDAELTQIDHSMQSLREACEGHNIERTYEMEQSFHERIIEGSHDRFLQAAYETLKPHIRRSRLYFTAHSGFYSFFAQEHSLITSVLKLRAPILAEAAMKRHLLLLYKKGEENQKFGDPSKLTDILEEIAIP